MPHEVNSISLRGPHIIFFMTNFQLHFDRTKKISIYKFIFCAKYRVDSEMYKFEILNMNRQEQEF
jgi:hypothetical protein